jgi:Tfp pilus assembly protein PilE
MKENMKKIFSALAVVALLSACASPTVVQTVKPGDTGLTCAQLQNEYSDAERFRKEADAEKGVTGGNVARLLFWPAIVGTTMNANEAIAAADNRKVHLTNVMMQKQCENTAPRY